MDGWPAMTRWTPDYLKALLSDEEVEIMAGRASDPDYEVNCQRHRRKLPFGEYVDMVHSGAETNDYHLVANNGFLRRPKPKQLLADIVMFPEYLDPRLADGGVFLWYGPAGTVTPLHHDTSNIFMAQVRGRKRIKLISPVDLEFLYNDVGVFSPSIAMRPISLGGRNSPRSRFTTSCWRPARCCFYPSDGGTTFARST